MQVPESHVTEPQRSLRREVALQERRYPLPIAAVERGEPRAEQAQRRLRASVGRPPERGSCTRSAPPAWAPASAGTSAAHRQVTVSTLDAHAAHPRRGPPPRWWTRLRGHVSHVLSRLSHAGIVCSSAASLHRHRELRRGRVAVGVGRRARPRSSCLSGKRLPDSGGTRREWRRRCRRKAVTSKVTRALLAPFAARTVFATAPVSLGRSTWSSGAVSVPVQVSRTSSTSWNPGQQASLDLPAPGGPGERAGAADGELLHHRLGGDRCQVVRLEHVVGTNTLAPCSSASVNLISPFRATRSRPLVASGLPKSAGQVEAAPPPRGRGVRHHGSLLENPPARTRTSPKRRSAPDSRWCSAARPQDTGRRSGTGGEPPESRGSAGGCSAPPPDWPSSVPWQRSPRLRPGRARRSRCGAWSSSFLVVPTCVRPWTSCRTAPKTRQVRRKIARMKARRSKAVPSSPRGLSMLGRLEAYHDGIELDLGPRKQRAVLACCC